MTRTDQNTRSIHTEQHRLLLPCVLAVVAFACVGCHKPYRKWPPNLSLTPGWLGASPKAISVSRPMTEGDVRSEDAARFHAAVCGALRDKGYQVVSAGGEGNLWTTLRPTTAAVDTGFAIVPATRACEVEMHFMCNGISIEVLDRLHGCRPLVVFEPPGSGGYWAFAAWFGASGTFTLSFPRCGVGCPACYRSCGYVKCPDCDDKGLASDGQPCSTCGGSASLVCPQCKGTGASR